MKATAEIYPNVHYRIIWAEMGYKENPQKYIVKVEKSTTRETWKVKGSSKRKFSVNVSFQFVKTS